MERLEISEILLSEIPFENNVLRIDAEYFKKQYLKEDRLRKKYFTTYLGNDYFITDGQHGYHEVDEDSEIKHLTAKNFKNWFADDTNADRLAKWVDDNNQRSSLKVNDVILTTRGSVGYCAIVKEDVLPANIDQDVARIARNENSEIRPQYLMAYINSKYGQDWVKRNQTGMVQQGLALWRVKEFPIPKLDNIFQARIAEVVEKSYNNTCDSKQAYKNAEQFLLQEIGLKNFEPSNAPVNIKNLSESFGLSGRLDAEYYQVKYENYSELIKKYSNGFEPLEFACKLKLSNFNLVDNREYKYIELSNIGKTGDVTSCTVALGKDLPSRARRLVNTHDLVISSIEGSLQSCGLITEEYDKALCSTGFYVINSNKINSETLLVLFKSDLMQSILKQNCSGTILTAINKNEFLNIPIPIIDFKKQQQIAELVKQSFKLKNQSEKLLEVAKRAVEIAIEENEATALDFIAKNAVL